MRVTSLTLAAFGLVIAGPAFAADAGDEADRELPRFQLKSSLVTVASAQDDEEFSDEDLGLGEDDPIVEEGEGDALTTDEPAATVDSEVEEGGATVGEDTGGATGFVFPTGFYVSSDLGGFVRFGGYGDSRDGGGCFRCVPKVYSNLQPWIGINIGYDIIKNFGVEMTLGTGFIADAAPAGYAFYNNDPIPQGITDSPENSAVTMLNVALTGSWYFLDRLAIQGKGFVGGAVISPDPNPANLNLVRGLTCGTGFWGSPSPSPDCGVPFGADFGLAFGFGLGLRYATLLTDVVVGFDLNAYGVLSPNVSTGHTGSIRFAENLYLPPPISLGFGIPLIPAVSFAPVIKYVF